MFMGDFNVPQLHTLLAGDQTLPSSNMYIGIRSNLAETFWLAIIAVRIGCFMPDIMERL